jgi:hypothetical protein
MRLPIKVDIIISLTGVVRHMGLRNNEFQLTF